MESNVLKGNLVEAFSGIGAVVLGSSYGNKETATVNIKNIICDGLEELSEFALFNGRDIINEINRIKVKFHDDPFEDKICSLLDNVLRITIVANRHQWFYSEISETIKGITKDLD